MEAMQDKPMNDQKREPRASMRRDQKQGSRTLPWRGVMGDWKVVTRDERTEPQRQR
jgi:hypothetical protein